MDGKTQRAHFVSYCRAFEQRVHLSCFFPLPSMLRPYRLLVLHLTFFSPFFLLIILRVPAGSPFFFPYYTMRAAILALALAGSASAFAPMAPASKTSSVKLAAKGGVDFGAQIGAPKNTEGITNGWDPLGLLDDAFTHLHQLWTWAGLHRLAGWWPRHSSLCRAVRAAARLA